MSVWSGQKVYDEVLKQVLPGTKVGPNGVDLPCEAIYKLKNITYVHEPKDSGVLNIPKSGPKTTKCRIEKDRYRIGFGVYEVVLPMVEIPAGAVAFVAPRSTFNRNAAFQMFPSAVWDSGFRGRGTITIKVDGLFDFPKNTPLVQMWVMDSEESGLLYDGRYQNGT